jgi:hypothetical protein
MEGKITLITPPDIFENSNKSVLFINLNEIDQDKVSQWLSDADIKENINFYVYTGESNVHWLLYALARCEHKYIDINVQTYITQSLGGYILGKSGVYFKTKDENLAAVYSHINQNRVTEIEKFLEILLSE